MKLKHKKLTALLVLFSFLSYMPLATSVYAVDLPNAGSTIGAGSMDLPSINGTINGHVTHDNTNMNVTVDGGAGTVGQFDWNSFNVGAGHNVNFEFTNNHQTSLNRVIGNNLSQIYGNLSNTCAGGDCTSYAATGKVILINPAGIMFGAGSQVDLNSFTATTYDLKGAQNIKDLNPEQLKAYKNKLNIQGTDAKGNVILSDMVGAGAQFIKNGTLATQDGASVTLEGSNFNIDKSLGIAADNVTIYKNSLIKTNLDPNYGGGLEPKNHNQSFSNVRIVTADGVNFKYQINGHIKNYKAVKDDTKDTTHNLRVEDANIQSGLVEIENTGSNAASQINIKNSVVRGVKLASLKDGLYITGEYGDVQIKGQGDVNIDNSTIITNNKTYYQKDADGNTIYDADGNAIPVADTKDLHGGRILISAGKNVNVTNSKIDSAGSSKNWRTNDNNGNAVPFSYAGDIAILANNGNAKIENTNVMAKGNIMVGATGKADIKDSALQAKNLVNRDLLKKVEVTGKTGINFDNSYSESTERTTFFAPEGTIGIKNNSTFYAGKALNLYGKDTTIADSTLVFNGLNFVHPEGSLINNVTISGTTSLLDKSSLDGLTLTTNGNLTIDNNSLLQRDFSSTVDKDSFDVTVTLGDTSNQDKITLESTKGNVTIKNGSNIATATDDITVKALDSAKGEIFVQNSTLTSAGDILLNQYKTHTAGVHLTKDSTLNANNIKLTTKGAESDINAALEDFANLNYTERLALNAGRDVNITGTGNLNALNVDFNAARNNNIDVTGNVTTDNSVFKGQKNNITATGDVTFKKTTIKAKDSEAPENTITTVNAGGNITTPDTNPADKNYLDIKNTKFIANADKNIDLSIANAKNKKAGIEINSKYTSDQLSDKTVTVNAADNVLAISKIKAGNLNLDKNDTFLAALTDLTISDLDGVAGDATGRAYIEVANWGQFNLDPLATFDQFTQPDSFTYTDHFVKGQHQPEAGDAIDTYKKHFIQFDSNNVMEKFLLVYEKPVSGCEPPGPVDPTPDDPYNPTISDDLNSLIEQMRLPRQLQPTSRVANIANNTTDPTVGAVQAAGRIEVLDEDTANTRNDKDENEYEI